MLGRLVLVVRLAVRDLRRRRTEAVLLLVAIAVASTTLTLGLLLHGETNRPYDQTRAATAGPDVVASVYPLPNTTVSREQLAALIALNHAGGVVAHSGPYPMTWTTLRRNGHTLGAQIEGRDPTDAAVDQPRLTSGSWVRAGGAVVERTFAEALGVHVGDSLDLGGTSFRVDGIAVTAAFTPYPQLCADGCALTTPQLRTTNPGLIWLTRADTEHQAVGGQLLTYYDNVRLSDPSTARAFADNHNVAGSPTAPSLLAWQEISRQDADLIHDEQTTMTVGAWLLAALAVATMMVLVGARLGDQARRVGLLKAVGASPRLVTSILLAEYLAVTVVAAALGLVIGRLAASPLTKPGAGLLGTAGAPALTTTDAAVVLGVTLALTALATVLPAVRAARTSTLEALTDPARPPNRVASLIRWSGRLPVPLLLGLRLVTRRPRRTMLATIAVAVAVAGIVVILFAHVNLTVHEQGAAGLTDPRGQRLGQLMLALSIMLALMAAVNLVFVTTATAVDARTSLAIIRALGASPDDTTLGLSLAQLVPAAIGALAGIPLGTLLFAVLSRADTTAAPPWWQLLVLVPATSMVALALTALPARIGARRPIASILQAEHT